MNKQTINFGGVEFGYELIAIIPYANWLYQNDLLRGTISGKDTKEMYFFSPNHIEVDEKRSWSRYLAYYKTCGIPNIVVHRKELNDSNWLMPDYKSEFKSKPVKGLKDTKPLLVISNKYNQEWGKAPINFIDNKTLLKLFEMLSDRYQIVYNHMTKNMGFDDGIESLSLNEFGWIRRCYPEALIIQDLLKENPDLNYNSLQLRLYSKASRFISVQGGTSIISSLFGGNNIIFAREGQELKYDSYSWYHKFSGCEVLQTDNYSDLIKLVKVKYL